MKKVILLLPVLLLNFCLVLAQDAYERKVFVSSSGDSLNYRLLEPETMQTGEKYPLVLFLHGAGERGNDNEKQLTHGAQMFLNPVNREKYPVICFVPAMSGGQLLGIRKSSAFFYARSDAGWRGNAFAVSGGKGNARYVSVKPAGRQVESLYRRIVYGGNGYIRYGFPLSGYLCSRCSYLWHGKSNPFVDSRERSVPYLPW